MIRLIPPISAPVRWNEVASSLGAEGQLAADEFARALAESCRAESVHLFGSGRAAMTAFFASCKRAGRDEVAMPAYTCWSVPAAAVRAGLRVRWLDVDPATFDLDAAALATIAPRRTACVVLGHLFARSSDVASWVDRIRTMDPDIRVLEDSAQAWPEGRGSADALLLSFARGKPMALGGGGALLHDRSLRVASPTAATGGWAAAIELACSSVLARPEWYRFPESLPFLKIGTTVYDPGFSITAPFRAWQGALGCKLIEQMAALGSARTRNAARLIERFTDRRGWTVPAPARAPGPIRFPVLAPSRDARDRAVGLLRRRGVAASAMYPGTIADIDELRGAVAEGCPAPKGASEIAARLIVLPVYPTLTSTDLDHIVSAVDATLTEVEG